MNPRAPNAADCEVGEEGALDEEVNEVLRVEWTTCFARLERWTEEVELLQEEMRQVVVFLEWKSVDWLAKADARGEDLSPDIQSGLRAYARKQATIYHDLAVPFAKLWCPTLVSYGLQHLWITDYMKKHQIPLTNTIVGPARGIFKFRVSDGSYDTTPGVEPLPTSAVEPDPIGLPTADATTSNHLLLEEASCGEDSSLEDGDMDSETDLDDNLDF